MIQLTVACPARREAPGPLKNCVQMRRQRLSCSSPSLMLSVTHSSTSGVFLILIQRVEVPLSSLDEKRSYSHMQLGRIMSKAFKEHGGNFAFNFKFNNLKKLV